MIKLKNIAIEIYLELDAFENISVSVPCRLGLADTFCCFFYKFYNRKLAFLNN